MVTLRINLASALHNLKLIKERVRTHIYAVVKADAYGHGAELAKYIESEVYGFAVSCVAEAEELIRLKIKKPILILCPTKSAEAENGDTLFALDSNNFLIDYQKQANYQRQTVDQKQAFNPKKIDRFKNLFKSKSKNLQLTSSSNVIYTVCGLSDLPKIAGAKVALKINTGMNRLGAGDADILPIIKEIKKNRLILSEVFTHFSSLESAEEQFEKFESYTEKIGDVPRHCCASNCMVLPPKMFCSSVRCGLALYGYGAPGLMPIMSAYTYIGQVNEVKKGMRIGYGNYYAEKDMKVAILKAGYADGIRRTEGRCVRINGCTCPIVGKICMDMCMADVTDIYVEKGDRAYFLDSIINAEALAAAQNTIPYEILTMFSAKRICRVYE